MKRIYLPTTSPEDWRRQLAEPEKQWRMGYSARTLAYAWEAAAGFPPEVAQAFAASSVPAFHQLELLLALPEYKVPLPGGGRASQNDLFVLARALDGQLLSIMVEGKVAEPFGPTLEEWLATPSRGKQTRLRFLMEQLGLPPDLPPTLRYQLLHRAASAVIEATRFNARSAVMLVHSFSPDRRWFEDYAAFVALFGAAAASDTVTLLAEARGIRIYTAWVAGNPNYLSS